MALGLYRLNKEYFVECNFQNKRYFKFIVVFFSLLKYFEETEKKTE